MIQFECSFKQEKFVYNASQTALQVDVIKTT